MADTIGDLPAPVSAARAAWLVVDHWMGFTSRGRSARAEEACRNRVLSSVGDGYVLEYITLNFRKPNKGYENHPRYLRDKRRHQDLAGRFVALHRLNASFRPPQSVVGEGEYKYIQDVWARDAPRWSVVFEISESYEIVTRPIAKEIFSADSYSQVIHRQASGVRPMTEGAMKDISRLVIRPRQIGRTAD